MKINVNSWHFKLFNLFRSYSTSHYLPNKDSYFEPETITDCQYFRILIFNAFLVVLFSIVGVFFSFLMGCILLEPWLVLGNWLLGHGWQPIIEASEFFGKEEPDFSMAFAGAFIQLFCLIAFLGYKFYSWAKNIERPEVTAESFPALAYQRYSNWRDKVCHKVEFTKE